MSHTLKVRLDREPDFYSTEDVISGTIHLTVKKDIEVKDIQVKLQGHANTSVTVYTYNHKKERRRDTRDETHELFYDVMTVFPPPNVRDAMKNSKSSFTLTPGVYTYPFSLKFSSTSHCANPDVKRTANLFTSPYEAGARKKSSTATYQSTVRHFNTILPPSLKPIPLDENSFNIRYSLKVSLHRTSFFTVDTRMERQLTFFPRGPSSIQAFEILKTCYFLYGDRTVLDIPSPGKTKSSWLSSTPTHQVDFTFGATTSQMLIPGTMPFSLHILSHKDAQSFTYDTKEGPRSLGEFYLTELEIGLRNNVRITASGNGALAQFNSPLFTYTGSPFKIDLAKLKPSQIPSSQFEYDIDITRLLENQVLPHMTPSFATCNGSIDQGLYIKATFRPGIQSGGRAARVALSHTITVLSPIMDTDEITQADYTAPPATDPAIGHYSAPSHPPPGFEESSHKVQHEQHEEEDLPSYHEATTTSTVR